MNNTFLITQRNLADVRNKGCWGAENMEAHGAEGSELTYIGSEIKDSGWVYDYYIDNHGRYWHKNRMRLPNGQIVSMEKYLFGTENLKRKRHQQ